MKLISKIVVIFSLLFMSLGLIQPTVTVDFSKQSELTYSANGYLYGFAQPDIPSNEIAQAVGAKYLAAKPIGGLQHPIGDIDDVAETFLKAGGENIMIYTQDMYDTWYYKLDSIELYNERVRTTVSQIAERGYSDKVSYCIYNESDNGEWFGSFSKKENRQAFYDAWKGTYEMVKSIDSNAVIAGPGYMGYNNSRITEFLRYCKKNNCLPDIVVWHELGEDSLLSMESHFNKYYTMCKLLNIDKAPICISEYGLMNTNGVPGSSVRWIKGFENNDVDGCVAYWRLADNLSEVVADDVTMNSNSWVYKFYSDMSGKELAVKENDVLKSNYKKFLLGTADLAYNGFTAVASFDEQSSKICVLAGGGEKTGKVVIENINSPAFADGQAVKIDVKVVDYKGLGGAVTVPTTVSVTASEVKSSKISFTLPCERTTQAFLVEIVPVDEPVEEYFNDNLPTRYEAESALLENVTTGAVTYASSGNTVVKGLSKDSSVRFSINAESSGEYAIDFVYGLGAIDGERKGSRVRLLIDGENKGEYTLKSTIKDECMELMTMYAELDKGEHILELKVLDNAVLSADFIDVARREKTEKYYIEKSSRLSDENQNVYAISVEGDGRYDFVLSKGGQAEFTVNGFTQSKLIENNAVSLYLHRGYNKVGVSAGAEILSIERSDNQDSAVITPDGVKLYGSATVESNSNTSSGKHIGWISSDKESGCEFEVNAENSGYYQFTFEYANNEEGGFHSYNVDLIERYITVAVNGEKIDNVFFRNTYSWENYKTRTVTLYLEKGINKIDLSNDGANSFNNRVTYAPNIGSITVSEF